MRSGSKKASGPRSSIYSRSRFTNWMPFDPYHAEVRSALTLRIRPTLRFGPDRIPIYDLPLAAGFIRPYLSTDVRTALEAVPVPFLNGLRGVYLLGGRKRQLQTASSSLFRYGCYVRGSIFLHAFPTSLLRMALGGAITPSQRREFEAVGAVVESAGRSTSVTFGDDSLRRFFLEDVLLHEVGHHVDVDCMTRPNKDAERYAKWFVQERSRLRRLTDRCSGP